MPFAGWCQSWPNLSCAWLWLLGESCCARAVPIGYFLVAHASPEFCLILGFAVECVL